MRTVLRSTLETAIRDETEVQDLVSQTEMFRRIDSSYRKVFGHLVEAYGQSYFRAESPTPLSVLPDIGVYDLPADFFNLISAFALVDGYRHPLTRLDPQNADLVRNLAPDAGRTAFFYEVLGRQRTSLSTTFKDVLALLPLPRRAFTIEFEYVPHAASFESAGDVTYADPNGWASDYVVADVSAFCMRKRQESQADYIAERDEAVATILRMRDARDAQPGRVRDVRSRRDGSYDAVEPYREPFP